MSTEFGLHNVSVVLETISTSETHAGPSSDQPLMDAAIVLAVAAVVWALSQWLGRLHEPHRQKS